jgi:hypothetical protein
MRVDYIWSSFDKEITELEKNSNSHIIIHNYESGPDILDQVNNTDKRIVDLSISKNKKNEKVS